MTRKEALNALIDGHIITHKILKPTKFIYKVGARILDNSGNELAHNSRELRLVKSEHSIAYEGWELVHPEEIKTSIRKTNLVKAMIIDVLIASMAFVIAWVLNLLQSPEDRIIVWLFFFAALIINVIITFKIHNREKKQVRTGNPAGLKG